MFKQKLNIFFFISSVLKSNKIWLNSWRSEDQNIYMSVVEFLIWKYKFLVYLQMRQIASLEA